MDWATSACLANKAMAGFSTAHLASHPPGKRCGPRIPRLQCVRRPTPGKREICIQSEPEVVEFQRDVMNSLYDSMKSSWWRKRHGCHHVRRSRVSWDQTEVNNAPKRVGDISDCHGGTALFSHHARRVQSHQIPSTAVSTPRMSRIRSLQAATDVRL